MAQGQGYASYAGIGIQSTLGTNVARTKFFDFMSESMKVVPQRKQWNNAAESGVRINTELGIHSEGQISVYGAFEGLESLFKQAFGSSCLTTANVTGTAYSQTYVLKSALKSPGVSLEINRDVTAFLYEGCQIEEVEFVQNPNDYLMINFLFRGRDETQVTATSPSFVTALKIHSSQLTFKAATVATTINSFNLKFKRNATGFRPQLGSNITKEIISGGKKSVTGNVSLAFEDVTRYNEFRALTNVALEFKYVGAIITGSETYQLKLSLPQVNWDGDTPAIGGSGPVDFSMPFTAFMTGRDTNDELGVFLENTITSVA